MCLYTDILLNRCIYFHIPVCHWFEKNPLESPPPGPNAHTWLYHSIGVPQIVQVHIKSYSQITLRFAAVVYCEVLLHTFIYEYITTYTRLYVVYDGICRYIMVLHGTSPYNTVYRGIGRYIENSKNKHNSRVSNPRPFAYLPAYSTAMLRALLPWSQQ